ncbi:MAG: CesT family type III secretion system chaperone [Chlamydiota bacterium]
MNPFQELLQGLAEEIGIPIQGDNSDSCALLVSDHLMVQVELAKSGEQVILGAHLGELVPGKYREELLKRALKENGRSYPHLGILGYSAPANQLALFDQMRLSVLNGEVLGQLFQIFVEKALAWQSAIRDSAYPEEISLPEPDETFVIR